jgi:hypothetical protein
MTTSSEPTDDARLPALLERIRAKSAEVDRYLGATGRRRRLLANLTIVAGTAAAALTAAPALGGESVTDWLTTTFSMSVESWRVLCALASVCSVAATLATQLHKSHAYDENILRAQGVRANLEIIDVSLTSGLVSPKEATTQFLQTIEKASFIDVR